MNLSEEQVAAHMARMEAWKGKETDPDKADPGLEKNLQGKCIRYCKDRGWPVFHDWSRGKNSAGWPDMFIFAPGRVILVELKAAGGRLSQEQITLRHMLNYLGHTVHLVRSYKRFVEIVGGDEYGNTTKS